MIDLLPQQRQSLRWILQGHGRLLAWVGSIRSGKTSGATLDLLLHMERYSGQACIIAGRTVGALERNVLPYLQQHAQALGIGYHHWRTKSRCDVGGNVWHLFGAGDSDSQDNVQGMTAAGLLVDEATLLQESFVQQALGRLSVPGARAILTMNPVGPYHWAKRQIVDRIEAGDLRGMVITSRLKDNRFIEPEVQEALAESFHGHYRERFIDARWASPAGAVYPRVPLADGDPPPLVAYDLTADFGLANPTAALLLGRDRERNWHAVSEYYHDGRRDGPRNAAEHAQAILALADGRPLERAIIDPTALALTVELRRLGFPVRKGRADQHAGIQALQSAFADDFLTIYPARVPATAGELADLTWDEKAAERGADKPHVGADHAADALRYWTMNRRPPRLTLQPVAKPAAL